MRNNVKKGVSLITLIITIVVMIILAGAIILTLSRTNTIGKANEAKFKQNVANYQDELNYHISELFLQNPSLDIATVNYSGSAMRTAIPSISDGDMAIFQVVAGKLVINASADDELKNWAGQVGISVAGGSPASSAPSSSNAPASAAPAGRVINPGNIASLKAAIVADTTAGYTSQATTKATTVATTVEGVSTTVATTVPTSYNVNVEQRVAQLYYGKKVEYTANGMSDWQLFYIGESGSGAAKEYNVYLIAKDYIPFTSIPAGMTQIDTYKEKFTDTETYDQTITTTNKMVTRGFITPAELSTFGLDTTTPVSGEYVAQEGQTLYMDLRCSLWLLNETKWANFATGTKAEAAYGGPTFRMLINSMYEYWGAGLEVSPTVTKGGYGLVSNSTGTDYLWVKSNSMYNIANNTKANGYHIASPINAFNTGWNVIVRYDGLVHYNGFNNLNAGLRPVVALSSSAVLTWHEGTGGAEGYFSIS